MRVPRRLSYLLWLPLIGCGFGDNLATHGGGTTGALCGDGIVEAGEGCDDGNQVSGDGCSATCTVETPHPVCGNGIVETGEQCDDGNTVSGDGCSATCQHESVCGDGVVEPGEQCDDGNTVSGDGCSSTCQTETATACVLLPQGDCSGATPACDLVDDDDGATGCRAVTKQGTSNDHCATKTDCKAGYTCVEDAPGSDSSCSRFCAVDGDCTVTGVGSRCVIGLTDHDGDPLNVSVCSNACDPYRQTGCPSAMGCLALPADAGDFTDCQTMTATIADGGACTAISDCAIGSTCVTEIATGVQTCEAYCLVGDDTTCVTGVCDGFATPLTIAAVEYGTCQ